MPAETVAADAMTVDHAGGGRESDADLLREHERGRKLDAAHHGRELLAAESPHDIGLTQIRRRLFGEQAKHLVADRVPETVVDSLETVEIEQQYRQRPRVLARGIEARGRLVEEGAPIGNPGKWIAERGFLVLQLHALLRHRDDDDREGDRVEERLQGDDREPAAAPQRPVGAPQAYLRARRERAA